MLGAPPNPFKNAFGSIVSEYQIEIIDIETKYISKTTIKLIMQKPAITFDSDHVAT